MTKKLPKKPATPVASVEAPKKSRKRAVPAVAELASAPVVAPVEVEPPPAIISDPEAPTLLKLSDEERLKLRLYESETARWATEALIRQGRRTAYLQKIDPEGQLGKMDQELRAIVEKSTSAKRQYIEVGKLIESRLGIKLSNYSFDDDSGALIPH